MEFNSTAEVLVEMAGIDADSKAIEIELEVLKLKNSMLYLVLEEVANKRCTKNNIVPFRVATKKQVLSL